MIFLALGIIEKEGKVLLSKRNRKLPMGNLWEFPTTIIEHGETIEDALEQWVFESLGVRCFCTEFFPAFDISGYRVFPVRMLYGSKNNKVKFLDFRKLLKINEIRKLRLSYPSVIFIKRNKKI